MYFTSEQLLSLMVCSSRAVCTHDTLNVTIKDECKSLVFLLAYRCAETSSPTILVKEMDKKLKTSVHLTAICHYCR